MEKVKQFFELIGMDAETVTNLISDEQNNDFSIEEAAKAYTEKRTALVLNDSNIIGELKTKFNNEQYPAIAKPIISRLKKMGGLSDDDLKELAGDGKSIPDIKAVFDLAESSYQKKMASTADEVKTQLFGIQNEYNEYKTEQAKQLQAIHEEYAKKHKMEKVKHHFSKIVSAMDLILPQDAADKLLQVDLFSRYNFDIDGESLIATNPDGTKAADGKNFLSAEQIITKAADDYKILKRSNGAEGAGTPPHTPTPAHNIPAGKLSDNAARIKKEIEEAEKRGY